MARLFSEWILRGPLKSAGLDSPFPKLPGLAGSRTESERVMFFVENVLAQRRYFAGENFTAADIMMHFPLKMGAAVATKTEIQDVRHVPHGQCLSCSLSQREEVPD